MSADRKLKEDVFGFEDTITELEKRIQELREFSATKEMDLGDEIRFLEEKRDKEAKRIFASLTPWQRVYVARKNERPTLVDYIQMSMDHFMELRGDRNFADDQAMLCGLARIEDQKFMLMGHRRGKTTKERIKCNFGVAHPEGYRKALQKMRLAEKFNIPIVSMINTSGAAADVGAEERGQAMAIAQNIFEMFRIKVPIIVMVIGEGGSGGALGIGVGDRVYALENSYYSVISPEGCANILWRDDKFASEAAEALKLTPDHLLKLGIIDEIVSEPAGGAHRKPKEMATTVRNLILRDLRELTKIKTEKLLSQRYEKFRKIGFFDE